MVGSQSAASEATVDLEEAVAGLLKKSTDEKSKKSRASKSMFSCES